MKNPCKAGCIIRVVCTTVCRDKINYGRLLTNAITQNKPYPHGYSTAYRGMYSKYVLKMKEHNEDLITIQNREIKRKKGI